MVDGLSSCGLIEGSTGALREAAKLLINSSKGCDMKLSSEPRNLEHAARCDAFDRDNHTRLTAARQLWGIE
jgi:hypothetical protein